MERRTTLINIFLEPIVEILVATSLGDLSLIVEFDLIHQQACETLRLPVSIGVFG